MIDIPLEKDNPGDSDLELTLPAFHKHRITNRIKNAPHFFPRSARCGGKLSPWGQQLLRKTGGRHSILEAVWKTGFYRVLLNESNET